MARQITDAQAAALKAHIAANTNVISVGGVPTQIKDVPNTTDTNADVRDWYNQPAAPAFTVWKKRVEVVEVGDNLVGTELSGLSTLNHTRLQTVIILSTNGVNPSLADRRQFFDDIFSGAGGVATRAKLLALWKRASSNAQKLFSTGTGTDAVPATTAANVGDGFLLNTDDVTYARNLP